MPRQGAHMVEPESMSVVELYHVHVASAENIQGFSVSLHSGCILIGFITDFGHFELMKNYGNI